MPPSGRASPASARPPIIFPIHPHMLRPAPGFARSRRMATIPALSSTTWDTGISSILSSILSGPQDAPKILAGLTTINRLVRLAARGLVTSLLRPTASLPGSSREALRGSLAGAFELTHAALCRGFHLPTVFYAKIQCQAYPPYASLRKFSCCFWRKSRTHSVICLPPPLKRTGGLFNSYAAV